MIVMMPSGRGMVTPIIIPQVHHTPVSEQQSATEVKQLEPTSEPTTGGFGWPCVLGSVLLIVSSCGPSAAP